MVGEDTERTRRRVLRALAGTGLLSGLAGCNALGGTSNTTDTESPTVTESATAKAARTQTATSTATPDQPPRIVSHSATPQEHGQVLAFRIEAEDDTELAAVRVTYGDQKWVREDIGESPFAGENRFSGLAGDNPEGGRVEFLARDAAGQESRKRVTPDEQAPDLSEFQVAPTRSAGEVSLTLLGEDDVGLESLSLILDGSSQLQQDASGATQASFDTTVDVSDAATEGETNTLTAALEDWNGNTTERDSDTYVRKFDRLTETRLELGANYLLWAGDKFGNCFEEGANPMPSIGQYDELAATRVRSRHIDQMQGYGVTNVMLTFNGTASDRRLLKRFFDSDLTDQIKLRPIYTIKDYRWHPNRSHGNWKDEVVPSDMEFIHNHILARENAHTYRGRPVVNIWNAAYLAWADKYHEQIMDEWGSYRSFTTDLRDHLRVNDTDPFIVGGIAGGSGYHGFPNDRIVDFIRELDATTTWVAGGAWGEDNSATWDEVLPWVEQDFQGHREFTGEHDMEFIPTVFPGFDDRPNTCWGSDRYTPRSLDGFTSLLELAEEYRTTPMVDIATWNDWTEGSQIEPGSFRGTDYGTAYLEAIKRFQQSS